MGSSQAIRALSALFFLSACSLAAAQRCTETKAPQIDSVITQVRGVQVNGGTGDQTAQLSGDAEMGSAAIKITGTIQVLDSCTLNGVANSFSPPTSAKLLITLANGITTNMESITTFTKNGLNGLYDFEFNTQTSYLNGATQAYTYTVEVVNDFGSTTTSTNPADSNAASKNLAFKFANNPAADGEVGALTAVSIGCPVTSATTMKSTTFAPAVNIAAPVAITCCSADCVLTGEAGGNTVSLLTNIFVAPASKLTLEKLTATVTQPLIGHIFLSGTTAGFAAAISWVNAQIEGDAASTINFNGAQTFDGQSTLFTGASTVNVNGANVDITAGNKLFILEDVIWNAAAGTTNIQAGSVLVVGTNSPTNSRSPGLIFTGSAACTVAGNGQITHIGGDIVYDGDNGAPNAALNTLNSVCPVVSEKKTEATSVLSHPQAVFTSNPNLYCCFATCGGDISINQGATMIMGRRPAPGAAAPNCAGLTRVLGKAGAINIAPDNKGGKVQFDNVDTTTSLFEADAVTNTANGAVVASLGPNIPVTPATINLFDKPITGASTTPQFIPSPPAHRTHAFTQTAANGFAILLGATILPTPTQSNGVVSPIDPPSAPTVAVGTVSSADDGSDKGLYGLFGILLIPLLCSLAICYFMKAKTDKADAQYAQDTAAFANVATAPTQGAGTYAGQGGYAMA